jgi:hypothetical protein
VTAEAAIRSPGILISLDALIIQRSEHPGALEDAAVTLRRFGWIGRPIILVGPRVAGRDLPPDTADREAWVRATIGPGAYAVAPFDEPSAVRGDGSEKEAAAAWRELREANGATWLVTDGVASVGPARQAGLKVIVVGPPEPQPRPHRPDYQARDLRDAVGHLLAIDVFSEVARASGGR